MPIISKFYGITIRMYFRDNKQHNLPHMHVNYNEYRAIFDLNGNIIEGQIPKSQQKIIQAWIEIHNKELNDLWNLLLQGKEGFKRPVLFPKIVFLYDKNLHGDGSEKYPSADVFNAGLDCSCKTMYPDWLSLTGDGYVAEMYKKYKKVVSPMGKCKSAHVKRYLTACLAGVVLYGC